MTDTALKTVLVLDTETQWYKPAGHNLSATQAVDLATQLASDGKTAKTIDQDRHHRAADASKCKHCKEAALQSTDESAAHGSDADARVSQE